MTAPAPVARQAPTGLFLEEGYQILITIGDDPDLSMWEIEVQPSGQDGGDPIVIWNQFAEKWIMKAAPAHKESTPITGTCAYSTTIHQQLDGVIGKECVITTHLPDGASLAQYGYLKSLVPQRHSRGAFSIADYEIVITNKDPDTQDEEDPVYTAGTGTP